MELEREAPRNLERERELEREGLLKRKVFSEERELLSRLFLVKLLLNDHKRTQWHEMRKPVKRVRQ